MSVDRLWNPWMKPPSQDYIKPTDIDAANNKIDPEAVARAKRLNEHKERIRNKQERWDALEEI